MVGPVLTRALQPFPVPVRTLGAIHLAAFEFIRARKQSVQLANYDEGLVVAAWLLGIAAWCEESRPRIVVSQSSVAMVRRELTDQISMSPENNFTHQKPLT